MKKILTVTSFFLCLTLLAGCSGSGGNSAVTDENSVTEIKLSDSGIEITGGGAKAEGSTVTIGAVGNYSVSGTLSDGQIVVDTGDEAVKVTLILNGADITNLSGPAIHIRQAKDARIQLAQGSKNSVTSGEESGLNTYSADNSGAAIYAEDDLDMEGDGALTVRGYINNGIACKDDLDINSGNINVLAANNGIRGTKSVEIKGGDVAVTAANDGIKSTEADKPGKGYIRVSGGTLFVQAGGDGISAATELTIEGGNIGVQATGDPALVSSKAVKAGTTLTINGGSLAVSAADHAIRSGGELSINGGDITATSWDGKAIAARGDITVTGGELLLSAGADCIETSGNVSISGGTLELSAGDDGIQAGETNSGAGNVTLSGGQVKISASGRSFNARGELILNGGELIALGGSAKEVVPSAVGSQLFVKIGWQGASGDELMLLSPDREELITCTAIYPYKDITISLPSLQENISYSFSKGWDSINVTATRNG